MAKTVFAGEQVEELSGQQGPAALAFSPAIFPRLPEDLFVSNSPGHTRDRKGENEQDDDLSASEIHLRSDLASELIFEE